MAKENNILVIDVGGDSLKMAEFEFPAAGRIALRAFAFSPLVVPEGGELGSVFAETLQKMIKENSFRARSVRLSLSGQSSFSRLSKLPPLMGNKSAINKIVEFEAKETVPYPMNEVVWDYQLLRHAWEDVRQEQQEDGSFTEVSEPHEEYEALFVAVKNDQVTMFTDPLQDAGFNILSVEIAPVALFNAAKGGGQCRDDECVLLLNIGAQGTNLMIADENRAFVRSIPIAGNSVTSQIAKEFGIGFTEAEDLKRRHGFVALGGAYEEPELEVAATISKIARNVMTRLHGEVSRSVNVWRSQHGGHAPSRVLLSGGGSLMMYTPEFFQEKLRLPVAYLNTFGTITLEDSVDRAALQAVAPMFQELIGMSFRSVTHCPIDISLIPAKIQAQKMLDRKKPYFYISAASLLICLAIFTGGISRRLNFDRSLVEIAKKEVERTTRDLDQVTRRYKARMAAEARLGGPLQFLNDRGKWSSLLNEVNSIMPDNMWLVKLEGLGTPEAPAAGTQNNNGGGFEMFGGPAPRAANPADQLSPNTRSIKLIQLTGYTLIHENKNLLEDELKGKLKNTKFFVSGEDGGFELVSFVPENEQLNMTSFVIRLKLKEEIRK